MTTAACVQLKAGCLKLRTWRGRVECARPGLCMSQPFIPAARGPKVCVQRRYYGMAFPGTDALACPCIAQVFWHSRVQQRYTMQGCLIVCLPLGMLQSWRHLVIGWSISNPIPALEECLRGCRKLALGGVKRFHSSSSARGLSRCRIGANNLSGMMA